GNVTTVGFGGQISPNQEFYNAGGIRIVGNQQTEGGNGVDSRSLLVTGVHVYFTNVVIGPGAVLSGDLELGHAYAELSAVGGLPAPGTPAALGVAAALAGRRRRGESAV